MADYNNAYQLYLGGPDIEPLTKGQDKPVEDGVVMPLSPSGNEHRANGNGQITVDAIAEATPLRVLRLHNGNGNSRIVLPRKIA